MRKLRIVPGSRRLGSAAAWMALVLLSSCVRLIPRTVSEPPAVVLDRHQLCASVERTKDWVDASADRNIFLLGRDEAVYSVLFFEEIRGAHTVFWKWYDPAGKLAFASDPVAVGAADRLFDRYVAWDRKSLAEENKTGFWTVAVFIDDRLAGTKEFEVKKSAIWMSSTINKRPFLDQTKRTTPLVRF